MPSQQVQPGQLTVVAKANKIPMLQTLLGTTDITDSVVTVDALQCQRDTVDAIVGASGHYLLTVKANQPTLRIQSKSFRGNRSQHLTPVSNTATATAAPPNAGTRPSRSRAISASLTPPRRCG